MTIDAPADPTQFPMIAIADFGIVVLQPGTTTATMFETDSNGVATRRTVTLPMSPWDIHAGPGPVLYGAAAAGPLHLHVGAFALSGDRVGQEVGFGVVPQLGSGPLGRGATGIVGNGSTHQWLGFVNEKGAPASLSKPAHAITINPFDHEADDVVVHDQDGSHDWHVVIRRPPPSFGSYVHSSLVAASSSGGAVLWTTLSAVSSAGVDLPPSQPAIAVLAANGKGRWYSLGDGWQVGTSDVQGTILEHRVGDKVELVRIDPNVDARP